MIERVLYDRITAGVAWFAADTARLVPLFQPEGSSARVSDAEMLQIRTWFAAKAPKVVVGYTRDLTQVPCYCIVLASEQPNKQFLAFSPGSPDGHPEVECLGTVEDRTYDLLCLGFGPDQTLYLYKILKNIIFRGVRELLDYLVDNPHYHGREIDPQTAMLPDKVFLRVLSLTVQVEEYFEQTSSATLIAEADVRRIEAGGGVEGVTT